MSHTNLKHYHNEEYNAKTFVETYFSHGGVDIIKESIIEPAKLLHELFSSGLVKGDSMLSVSVGSMVFPLLSACKVFKKIYVMDTTEDSINHFKQWLEKGDEATDWSFTSQLVCKLEGNADGWQEKEEQARRAVKGVYTYDLSKGGCKETALIPQVDCVIMVYSLNAIGSTKKDFKVNLKTFTSWLKVDGYLVFFVALNMTTYRIGDHRFAAMTVDEKFVREAVTTAGFVIEKAEILHTSVESDNVDYKDLLYVVARKVSCLT